MKKYLALGLVSSMAMFYACEGTPKGDKKTGNDKNAGKIAAKARADQVIPGGDEEDASVEEEDAKQKDADALGDSATSSVDPNAVPLPASSPTPVAKIGWLDQALKVRFYLAASQYPLPNESFKEIETLPQVVFIGMSPDERRRATILARRPDNFAELKEHILQLFPGFVPYAQLVQSIVGFLGPRLASGETSALSPLSICSRKAGKDWHVASADSLAHAEEDGLLKAIPDLAGISVWVARKNPDVNALPNEFYTFAKEAGGRGALTGLGIFSYDPATKNYGVVCAKREIEL